MTNIRPALRPWWKWYWTTWLCGGILLACILFVNCDKLIVAKLHGNEAFVVFSNTGTMVPSVGWPAHFWSDYGNAGWTSYPSLSASYQLPSPFLARNLAFDIFFALLVVAAVSGAAQLLRARHPSAFRVTILQILLMTAFAALWLVVEDFASPRLYVGGWSNFPKPASFRICDILASAIKLFIFAALGLSVFFLARPSWWRLPQAAENKDDVA